MHYSSTMVHSGVARYAAARALMHIILGALCIALCAQIRIPLFFTPVPLTLQTLSVLLVGSVLGSRQGALSVVLYLALSLVGLPVLSGGRADMLAIFGPLGGYLLGFALQAYVAGWFMERKAFAKKSLIFVGLMTACALQLACGGLWLGCFIGFSHIFTLGILPFIAGELLKVMLVTTFLTRK